jgi:hypothetical protein
MLKFLSKKIAFQWIIVLGLLALALYTVITKSHVAIEAGTPFLFKNFAGFFSKYIFFGKAIIIIVLLFQIILLQYYFRKHEYATRNSLLPACFFLSILLLTKSLIIISPFFFTLFFFLIVISIDFTGSAERLKNNAFWAGLIIALATGFDISSIVLLFIVMVTLIINQFSRIKEVGILLFGFTLLYLYFFSFNFFIDNLPEWLQTFQEIKFLGVLNSKIGNMSLALFSMISLGIVYMVFIIRFKLLSEGKIALQRKRVFDLNIMAILMMVCLVISNSSYPVVLGYLSVHLSVYLAMTAQEKSPLLINEWITIITLVALCL